MLTETVARLKNIYHPVTFFDPLPTYRHHQNNEQCNCKCSLSQKTQMMKQLEDPLADLEHLCNQVNLKVHQILIVCAELLEASQKIASVAESGKFIDMRVDLAPAIVRMAARLEDYYDDDSSVTPKDIEKDALLVADHVFS